MRKIHFVPLVFFIFGLIGAVLRRVELATAFDLASGLARRGAAVSVTLITLSAAVCASAFILALIASKRFEAPDSYKRAFYINSYLSFAVLAVLGISLMACAVVLAVSGGDILDLSGMGKWAFLILMVLSGCGMAVMGYSAYTLRDTPLLQIGSLMPSVFFCYWMVAFYRVNAGNPVLLEYSYPCLAFAAAAMSAYYEAGYAYGRRNVVGAVAVGLSAIYLLPIAAVSPAPMALRLSLVATAIYITINTMHLFDSLRSPKADRPRE